MFTTGLELLTCAAELSGPTCLSLERCWEGRAALSPAWLLLFVEKVFLLGRWGGGASYSCFTLWSCLSKKESCSPTPCLLTCQKTIQVIKPREIRSHTGTGGLGCGPPLLPSPWNPRSGILFSSEPGGGGDDSLSSPFSSQIQTTNRGPCRAPSSKLPRFI